MKWFEVDLEHPIRPLTGPQAGRAAGVILGMAVGDGWNHATELALCVADAAATGRALTDTPVLDLIRRNLRELTLGKGSGADALHTTDEMLATTAIVALAHLHDSVAVRAAATEAVLGVLNPALVVEGSVHRWVELIASTIRSGTSPRETWRFESGAIALEITDVVEAVTAADPANGEVDRSGVKSATQVPAATGALIGATYGWEAIPDDLAAQATGWPDAGAGALLALGLQIARLQSRSVEPPRDPADNIAGIIPVERWKTEAEERQTADSRIDESRGGADGTRWHRTNIVLTTGDANSEDPQTGQQNDR